MPAAPASIFVTRRLPDAGLDVLREAGVDFVVGQEDDERGLVREKLLTAAGECRVLLPLLTEKIDREVLDHGQLLGVASMAVGFDNIDIAAATELGVPVSNTPGVLTDTTADLTWALILAVARRVPQAHEYLVAGRYGIWGPNLFLGADVSRGGSGRPKRLGIVGYGRIGQAVARRAGGFDMDVVAHDPNNRLRVEASKLVAWVGWDEILATSDFLTLHPPLRPDTHHLIGWPELDKMRPNAILINTSRGPIVDEAALVTALEDGMIAGAGLDVYENEPEVDERLKKLPNVVLLPHIGSATVDTRGRMAAVAATNALAHLRREEAPNVVNPDVYTTEAYWRRIAD